ncbi:MAG TPA: MBL fold metallo-hydrolase [Chloroflexia bacterium]|nr:MBL fold metallo-hydrolase [Chloroflexia bacterium]
MRIAENCYAITGLGYLPPWEVNAGFAVGKEYTLVIDTGGTMLAAQTIHGYATCARPENQLIVINTERHLDHVNGNAFFRSKEVEIYGHHKIVRQPSDLESDIVDYNACIPDPIRRAAGEAQAFFQGTAIDNPTRPIHDEMELNLGGLEIQIIFTPGHTPTNISVFLPLEGVLYCGDCMVQAYAPNLDAGGPAEWQTWLESLDKIERLQPKVVMPGHGNVLKGAEISREIERIRATIETALDLKKNQPPI